MKFKELILFTNNLSAQRFFYSQILECPLASETINSVSFQIGNTLLNFKQNTTSKPYHFAINIPSNQELLAATWLKERVNILPYLGQDIIDFKNWNAKALYFYDADKNIVEFIARKNLANPVDTPFGLNSFLEISEIGIAVDNIQPVYQILQQHFGTEIYDGGFDKFCAVGGENGLFIIINKQKKGWFPMNDTAYSADFEAVVELKNKTENIFFKNGKLLLTID